MARIASLPPIKGPYDKGRMQLTHQEKTWALAIKEGIESEAEVDNLTDFWYAQLALICHDDVSNAIERAQQLQYLREEYNIVETYEFGRRCIHQAISLFPDYYLCLSFNHQDGNYVLVVDLTKLPMSTFRTNPNAVDIKVCEIYFMSHLMSPDFEAIRRGIICVAECEGYQMQHDIGVGIWRRVWDMVVPYPLNLQKIKHFHTGVMSNIMVSMVRQFLPRSIKDRIEVGCLSEAGRLDGMYLMPNKEAARKRTLSRLEDALQRRYNNEAAFKL
ncbi:expressed unknown protein [Seminavis robusta]|uniref:CRAL-TRIO domain-containing protein n=1 Tax=Seminavis robusta TaxID=568900 RepID=A0A9N8DJH0_9STRA|nr:expressed unknown protein [Seminavis robusta]|eukprot:Sro118_g057590.1 n/a (273) ;mRNA; r:10557-11375